MRRPFNGASPRHRRNVEGAAAAIERENIVVDHEPPHDHPDSKSHDARDQHDLSKLLRENAELQATQQVLVHRLEELQSSVRQSWAIGRGQPVGSTRTTHELKSRAADAQQQLLEQRREADVARQEASDALREAMRARSDAAAAVAEMRTANRTLASDRTVMAEHNLRDASEMSERLRDLVHAVLYEQERGAALTRELRSVDEARVADVARLQEQADASRRETSAALQRGKADMDRLKSEVEEARHQLMALSGEGAREEARLRNEADRYTEAAVRSRELAAGAELVTRARLAQLEEALASAGRDGDEIRLALDRSRAEYSRMSFEGRTREEQGEKEMVRLNALIERLGGEKAEDRAVMVERIEQLTRERDASVGELRGRIEQTTREGGEQAKTLRKEIEIMRALQRKCLQEGEVEPGRARSMFYLETLRDGGGGGGGSPAIGTGVGARADGGLDRKPQPWRHAPDRVAERAQAADGEPAVATPQIQVGRVLLGGSHMVTPGGATLPWPQAWE